MSSTGLWVEGIEIERVAVPNVLLTNTPMVSYKCSVDVDESVNTLRSSILRPSIAHCLNQGYFEDNDLTRIPSMTSFTIF